MGEVIAEQVGHDTSGHDTSGQVMVLGGGVVGHSVTTGVGGRQIEVVPGKEVDYD